MRNVRNRGFKHCNGTPNWSASLACDFWEVRDAIVVRIVDGRRVTVHRSDLVELFVLITCGVCGIGQVAKLLAARAEVRLDPRFRVGWSSARKSRTSKSGSWSRSDRQGTARKADETWEWRGWDGEIWHAHCKHLEPCVYAMNVRHAKKRCQRKMCVRHGVCVQVPSHTQ